VAKCPKIEPAGGVVNGVNRIFSSTAQYIPGSLRVFLNGLLIRQDLTDGWIELGNKKLRLHEAPKTGDIVQLYYLPV
jgi:hypothetical protein